MPTVLTKLRRSSRPLICAVLGTAFFVSPPAWSDSLQFADADRVDEAIGICDSRAAQANRNPEKGAQTDDENCYYAAPAVGQYSFGWRQHLPPKVRWLTRADAESLCTLDESEYGRKVGEPIDRGCVFVGDAGCTILTSQYVSHATIGNAVRNCAPGH